MKEQVNVRLIAHADVAYGEDLLICGSAQPLGCWSVAEAAPMTWQEGGRWMGQVALPCGVLVELKVVIKQQGGTLRWHGAGPGQEENVILETKLGRGGGHGTRFVGDASLPFSLEVADIEDLQRASPIPALVDATPGAAPASYGAGVPPPALAHDGAPPPAAPAAMLPYTGAPPPGPAQLLPYTGAPQGPGAGYAGAPAPVSVPPQQQEAAAAAMLAGAAAGAGHVVTYTTTTTTTVTINGAGDPAASVQVLDGAHQASPRHDGHYGKLLDDAEEVQAGAHDSGSPHAYGPGSRGPTPTGQPNGCGGSGCGGGAGAKKAEATMEQREAFLAAREQNDGLPRLGPVALRWPPADGGNEPSSVHVRGSWDGWARDLAMEPSPGGGWRLLMVLPPGRYELKFIVDGNWTTSDELDRTQCVNKNNFVCASDMALAPTISPLALGAPEASCEATSPSVALVSVGGC